MTRLFPRLTTILAAAALAGILLVLIGTAGCARTVPADVPAAPSLPPAMSLSSPQSAVRSYLAWTAYAYRMSDSDLASRTASPDEGVRVDSYIEMLKEKSRVIDQRLTNFAVVRSATEGTHTLVATRETWAYRYVSLDGKTFVTPAYSTSYEATYTVIKQPDGTWLVDSVDAKPLDEVH